MFRGPTRDQGQPTGLFGIGEAGTQVEGSGQSISVPQIGPGNIQVGLGNAVIIYLYVRLLPPTDPTHIKWIDIMPRYTWNFYANNRWPEAFATSEPITNINTGIHMMDTVPERDPVLVGTNDLYKRWRNIRFPNPADPDNKPPVARRSTPPFAELIMAHTEPAAADFISLNWFPVAVDSSEDAVLRDGEDIQIGVLPGGYARML